MRLSPYVLAGEFGWVKRDHAGRRLSACRTELSSLRRAASSIPIVSTLNMSNLSKSGGPPWTAQYKMMRYCQCSSCARGTDAHLFAAEEERGRRAHSDYRH